ncbi:MAG: hypothetical protein AB7E09_06475 [Candidatus Izemoplasmatales bacterium]
MQTKKIVLLIVEGPSDENALGPILRKIINNKNVRFKVTETDLTSIPDSIGVHNIESVLAKRVRSFLGNTFRVSDLKEIIHIIDTDGAFIDDSSVIEKDNGKIKYNDTTIETAHKTKTEIRNHNKAAILNHLSTIDKLEIISKKDVPYQIYFMSCNLDHVLHDNRNLASNKKIDKANEFSDSYFGKEKDFIDFMLTQEILVPGDYHKSWQEIQKENKSLLRGSNFAVYLTKYK